MSKAESQQITQLLVDWSEGNEIAKEQLFPLVYEELRQMARRFMRRQPSGHTFQTTELIHEAYLKIANQGERPKLAESRPFFWCRGICDASYFG